MPSNMDVIHLATEQLSSDDPIGRLAGFHILSIANAAKQTGIELRWPEAPFDGSHFRADGCRVAVPAQLDIAWNERARF